MPHSNPLTSRIEEARRQRGRFFDPETGALHVTIAGAAEGDPNAPVPSDPPPAPSPPEPKPEPKPEPGVSQATLDKAVERAVAKAKADAKAETDAYLTEQKRLLDEAQMNEADRKLAEAERKAEAAAAREAAAAEREFASTVKDALRDAGVPRDVVDRARNLVTVKAGATDDEIAADVEVLKAAMPALFTPTVEGKPGGKGPEVPGDKKPPSGAPKAGVEKGRELARAEAAARQTANPIERFQRVGAP